MAEASENAGQAFHAPPLHPQAPSGHPVLPVVSGILPSIAAAGVGGALEGSTGGAGALQKQSSLASLELDGGVDKDGSGPPLTPVLMPTLQFDEGQPQHEQHLEHQQQGPDRVHENSAHSSESNLSIASTSARNSALAAPGMEAGEARKAGSSLEPGAALSPLESWKHWGMQKLKVARRAIAERFGNTAPTSVDKELEEKVQRLQSIQSAYKQLIKLSKTLVSHLCGVVNAQKQLQAFFNEMAVHNVDLSRELAMNAEAQKTLHKNGLALISALNCFLEGMNTLTFKTIADTLATWDAVVAARLEFDTDAADKALSSAASPAPLSSAVASPAASAPATTLNPWVGSAAVSASTSAGSSPAPTPAPTPAPAPALLTATLPGNAPSPSPVPASSPVPAGTAVELPSEKRYRHLCSTLRTKLALLDENRIQVMRKQLVLFHSATCAFFTGNHSALEKLLADLHLMAVKADQVPAPSWLEQLQESAATTLGAL